MNHTAITLLAVASMLILSGPAISGHHYHSGYGTMPSLNMNELDENRDGSLTFDEYIENQKKKMRAGFDMIDTNGDGLVDTDEWNTLLEAHGIKTE